MCAGKPTSSCRYRGTERSKPMITLTRALKVMFKTKATLCLPSVSTC